MTSSQSSTNYISVESKARWLADAFCMHAAGDLESVVTMAIELGFTHYGLSEHMPRYEECDLYDEERCKGVPHLQEQFEAFVNLARQLQAKYADRIHLLVGMETEYLRDASVEQTAALVVKHNLDYLVGSVHHVHGIPIDYSPELYAEAELKAGGTEALFLAYFEHQKEIIGRIKPLVIGHFDVIRMYRPDFPLTPAVVEAARRNIAMAVSYGAIFEINSRALKKKLPNPYPQADLLKLIVEMGGKVTLSDDSHGPNDVGMFYGPLYEYLVSLDLSRVHFVERGDITQPVRVLTLDDWKAHPFWAAFR